MKVEVNCFQFHQATHIYVPWKNLVTLLGNLCGRKWQCVNYKTRYLVL